MFSFIITLVIISSVLMVLVVLAQNSKGGGLSSQFGGSGTSNLIGVKKTGDLLEKITWGLGIAILVLSLSTNFILDTNAGNGFSSPNIDRAQESVLPPSGLPNLDLDIEDNTDPIIPADTTGSN